MKISSHCYMISGLGVEPPWAVNSGFITGDHTTLIVDTGSTYASAQTIYGYAVCAAPGNKLVVVNTEPHFDHMGGNSFFQDMDIDLWAHPDIDRCQKEFEQTKDEFNATILNPIRRERQEADAFFHQTRLANPNKRVTPNHEFDLGGLTISLVETPGHTPFNISVFVRDDRVLYCGDAIVTGYLPNLEAGHVSDWQTWMRSIGTLELLQPDILVPGHGVHISGTGHIHKELNRVKQILEQAVREGKAPTQ